MSAVLGRYRTSEAMWERMRPLIPKPVDHHPLGCHRPRVEDRRAMDAILFVLRTGCQWNALNATGICSSSAAHRRFQEWTQAGVFWQMWCAGLMEYDELKGIDWEWLSGDGAMNKAPLAGEKTGPNPTDRAKSGTKRSLLVDGRGAALGLAVSGANVNDFKLLRETIESIPVDRPRPTRQRLQNVCLDKGYDYDEARELLAEFGFTAHIRSRGEEARLLARRARYRARRWVCERTHSWLNRFRGVLIRWCKKPENYVALLHLALTCVNHAVAGLSG
ncbi:MAG: IS5 family transposase [Phycisphaerae bacterium]